MKKIYILQDEEGVSGVINWETSMSAEESREARHLMTQEINAAVTGAWEGGAEEVWVRESHRFIPDELHDEVKLIQGTYALNHSFSAIFMVGQHAMARTGNAVLCHTYCHTGIREMLLNGEPIGEIGWTAAYAGCFNVPVALVTGDQAACEEARHRLGDIECAIVKEGAGIHSAVNLSPKNARHLINRKAKAAMARLGEFSPYRVAKPIELIIDYYHPQVAENAMLYPGVERLDISRIRFVAADFLQVFQFRSFSALIHGR